jgi:hypothetical protein
MTLKQKRGIVSRFQGGEPVMAIAHGRGCYQLGRHTWVMIHHVEQVLRDYCNGKFTLEPKALKNRGAK